MSDRTLLFTPPKKILLATDLSARSDRALDRATELARRWDAELVVVHAVEGDAHIGPEYRGLPAWRGPPDIASRVEAQIREDVRGECPRLQVRVREGDAVGVILDAIEEEGCDLVVLALGRYRPLGWPPLGRTIDELFRRSPVSVLVVKRRPGGPYTHLLVGTDFTDEARIGLETAAGAFPDAEIAVMHAFEIPYRSLLLDSPLAREFGEMEHSTIAQFVQGADLPAEVKARVATLIEHGPPDVMLGAYVMEKGADLTVIGAFERGRLFHTIVGGFGPRIVSAVPSDVLVVRPQRAEAPG